MAAPDWVGLARAAAHRPWNMVIGGELTAAADGAALDVVSPRDGTVVAQVPAGSAVDIDRAVTAARAAFETGPWPRLAPVDRKRILLRLAALVDEHADELAALVSLEMGKPIAAARDIELRAVVNTLSWYAEAADKLMDEAPAVGAGALALVTREPVGVVGAVVPWNFPLTMAAWKIAPALAVGNVMVLKPAEQSPLSALRLAELALDAGLPPGTLNVVTGLGPVAGAALGLHPGVDTITFTGSTEVGRRFLEYSAASNVKPVWLELGGKTPTIVFDDAVDLDAAARAAAWGIFFNQGEMCSASSRLILHDAVHDEVLERVTALAVEQRVGDPLDSRTTMGPLVSAEQRRRVLGYVDAGREAGARLVTGGGPVAQDSGGYFVAPTVFADVEPQMVIARDEIFGPVVSVLRASGEDEAVRLANDTPYGLAASVWTADLNRAHRVSRAIQAGTVWVNCFEEGDLSVPFGGRKLSGFGADKSLHAIDKFTVRKTTWIELDR